MKVVEKLHEKRGPLMGFLMAILLTACAAGVTIGAGCEVYASYRVSMPDPTGASREFLEWFNLLDVNMLSVCKRG
jgi:hypothetical protein